VETGKEPAGRLRLRGITRWLSLGFFGLFGLGLLGWAAYEGTKDPADPQGALIAVGLFAAGLAVIAIAFRAWRRGIDADAEGVVVTNLVRTHRLAWSELVDISFDEVMNDGGGTAYHRLRLETEGRRSIVAEAPGGSTKSGSRLDRARADLLAMRDQAVHESP
jgi:4-amino-4-deoxy-L-arabinose transferase-like glycosyltransferase